ncbi:TraR/DksA family transcriptional regulator [Streptomyces meridianus]|uniref:TraR/DksA family transcriptional regulator n=1 Tax=Streptomyces meridianus TaxID=2938945 RepID=A0ABT0X3H3_9ACTN|nr:TraR/DksA family transcriptional regulator [Streptomyces meridianus]MCM2576468.1 TraR/DksA family transcriptional regulator [Streptomyces meridianus]
MVARKTTAKQAETADEAATEKPVAAGRTAAKKSTKKTAAKKSAAKKTTAKKSTAKTAPARKTATVKKTVTKKTVTAGPAGKTAKKTVKKTAERVPDGGVPPGDDRSAPAVTITPEAAPEELAVRPGEEPWTPEEVAEAREGLLAEKARLADEIQSSEEAITGLMRDSGDGAGDDQADTGTKNITREHELALAANAREMLQQTVHALERIDTGTYGLCESCGNAIGKGRMLAFPRATLCVECKQREERR